MDEPYDIVDRPDAKTLKTAGQIEFDRVSFKYNDRRLGASRYKLNHSAGADGCVCRHERRR